MFLHKGRRDSCWRVEEVFVVVQRKNALCTQHPHPHTHAHTHTRTHARTHARTHIHNDDEMENVQMYA